MSDGNSRIKQKEKASIRAFLPAIGLIVAGLCAVVAIFLSSPVHNFLIAQFGSQIPNAPEVQYVIAFGLFLVFITIFGLIYAFAAPKPEKMVSERELDREKREREAERRQIKKNKKMVKEKQRDERQRNSR